MTAEGCPSAAARLIRRPSPSTKIRRPSAQGVLLHEWTRLRDLAGHLCQGREVDLDVKVAGVGQDGSILHDLQVLPVHDVDVAGGA